MSQSAFKLIGFLRQINPIWRGKVVMQFKQIKQQEIWLELYGEILRKNYGGCRSQKTVDPVF